MQSVANVICNRAQSLKTTLYAQCIRPWQFSSITAKGDPQLTLWPPESDPQWIQALQIAADAVNGTLKDITAGSTFYYAASMANPPEWAAEMQFTVEISGQKFFRS